MIIWHRSAFCATPADILSPTTARADLTNRNSPTNCVSLIAYANWARFLHNSVAYLDAY